jgi:hypothetical protein
MKKMIKLSLVAAVAVAGLTTNMVAADNISDAFSNGKLKGSLKSYYFAQKFDGAGKNDSSIWANGGSLNYVTDSLNGLVLGATMQTSHVASIDDKDSKTKSSMDAQGSVLSESYLQYTLNNTTFKGGRQFVKTPLLAGSGSRLIKEAFEAYLLVNTDIPDTTIVAGKVTKYQQRTDYTTTAPFTSTNTGANGGPGEFMKIGTDGINTIYVKNTSIPNLAVQFQYADAVDIATLGYLDAVYKVGGEMKPFIAAQYYDTDYDSSASKDNSLYGLKAGITLSGLDIFAGYTSADGKSGDAAVVRGLGQGAYSHYTATTKTAGGGAFNAGTDSYQVGAAYKFNDLSTKLRYSSFDNPTANADLDEITLNLAYKFTKSLVAQIDYSILNYENNTNDATDLRTRLIYTF